MYIPCTTRLHIPLAHPSCSYYYSLSPSILFFAKCKKIFCKIVLFCTFYSIAHLTLISLFLPYTVYALVFCYFYRIFIFILLHCPLSGPDLIYISLLIIPCIIYYVINKKNLKETLTLVRGYLDDKVSVFQIQQKKNSPLGIFVRGSASIQLS